MCARVGGRGSGVGGRTRGSISRAGAWCAGVRMSLDGLEAIKGLPSPVILTSPISPERLPLLPYTRPSTRGCSSHADRHVPRATSTPQICSINIAVNDRRCRALPRCVACKERHLNEVVGSGGREGRGWGRGMVSGRCPAPLAQPTLFSPCCAPILCSVQGEDTHALLLPAAACWTLQQRTGDATPSACCARWSFCQTAHLTGIHAPCWTSSASLIKT